MYPSAETPSVTVPLGRSWKMNRPRPSTMTRWGLGTSDAEVSFSTSVTVASPTGASFDASTTRPTIRPDPVGFEVAGGVPAACEADHARSGPRPTSVALGLLPMMANTTTKGAVGRKGRVNLVFNMEDGERFGLARGWRA